MGGQKARTRARAGDAAVPPLSKNVLEGPVAAAQATQVKQPGGRGLLRRGREAQHMCVCVHPQNARTDLQMTAQQNILGALVKPLREVGPEPAAFQERLRKGSLGKGEVNGCWTGRRGKGGGQERSGSGRREGSGGGHVCPSTLCEPGLFIGFLNNGTHVPTFRRAAAANCS